jgi:hypothetical protein
MYGTCGAKCDSARSKGRAIETKLTLVKLNTPQNTSIKHPKKRWKAYTKTTKDSSWKTQTNNWLASSSPRSSNSWRRWKLSRIPKE